MDGPPVFWKISMYDNPRALTAGREALAAKTAEETDGKVQFKTFLPTNRAMRAKTWTV